MSNPEFIGAIPLPPGAAQALKGLLQQHINGGCDDPGCESCNGTKKPVRDITDEELQAHLAMTSYKPQVRDRVRLSNFGKSIFNFPGDARTGVVTKVLPATLYDPAALDSPAGAQGVDVCLAFVLGAGRVIEILFPASCLERVTE